jgi:cytochrome c-type protein NapB
MNRDGNFLADVSPNRYFCTQCHASQQSVKLLIENDFVSMDELFLKAGASH